VDYAHALLWLLHNPNLSSILNCDCPENECEYETLARRLLAGGEHNGREYTSILVVPEAPPPPPSILKHHVPVMSFTGALRARFNELALLLV